MYIYDQHLHSSFSFDSTQPMEPYAARAAEEGAALFVTTEHLDLAPVSGIGDIVPDFAAQRALCTRLSSAYGLPVLFGVEAGWRPDQKDRLLPILASQPFDIVVGALHETATVDYYAKSGRAGFDSDRAMYAHYLARVEEMTRAFHDYDVLAHIDYGQRKTGPVALPPFEEVLTRILGELVRQNKALELNGRLVSRDGLAPQEYLARLFLRVGGTRFTLGSDGHSLAAWQDGLAPLRRMLMELGVPGLTVYRGRVPCLEPFL